MKRLLSEVGWEFPVIELPSVHDGTTGLLDTMDKEEQTMEQQYVLILYERYRDLLYRICCIYMKNEQDALDAMQNTLLKLLERVPPFEDEEHARRWLIRVAVNECKSTLSHWWRQHLDIEECTLMQEDLTEEYMRKQALLDSLLSLPPKQRMVFYLHHYEGYSTGEIAAILSRRETTVRSDLRRAKQRLRVTVDEV
ncbi:MAG: RNA polymerase sigma factor [Lachnospiraceae bacterium]|nr:RNA polymerase sigma factor [Lachnospiraceae bacterium]